MKYLIPIILIWNTVGVVGMIVDAERFAELTVLNLVVTLLFVLIADIRAQKRRLLWSFLIAYGIGMATEIIGVNTGLLFGEYEYGQTFGPKVFDVALIVGVMWWFVTYAASIIIDKLYPKSKPILQAILVAALVTLFDVFLEQAAIRLGYWQWSEGDIPLSNYLTWFVVALPIAYANARLHIAERASLVAPLLLGLQLALFTVVILTS